jgi:hypothetical protein
LIDRSAIQTLYEIVEEFHNRQVLVCFVKLRTQCKQSFLLSGLIDLVGHRHFYAKMNDAVTAINAIRSLNTSPISERPPNDSEIRVEVRPANVALPFRRPPSPTFVSFDELDHHSA